MDLRLRQLVQQQWNDVNPSLIYPSSEVRLLSQHHGGILDIKYESRQRLRCLHGGTGQSLGWGGR